VSISQPLRHTKADERICFKCCRVDTRLLSLGGQKREQFFIDTGKAAIPNRYSSQIEAHHTCCAVAAPSAALFTALPAALSRSMLVEGWLVERMRCIAGSAMRTRRPIESLERPRSASSADRLRLSACR